MKSKKAVAIKRFFEEIHVVGKGEGYIAYKIIETAKEHEIPIKRDAKLVQELYEVELYEQIPQEMVEDVAKVLEFLYNIKKR